MSSHLQLTKKCRQNAGQKTAALSRRKRWIFYDLLREEKKHVASSCSWSFKNGQRSFVDLGNTDATHKTSISMMDLKHWASANMLLIICVHIFILNIEYIIVSICIDSIVSSIYVHALLNPKIHALRRSVEWKNHHFYWALSPQSLEPGTSPPTPEKNPPNSCRTHLRRRSHRPTTSSAHDFLPASCEETGVPKECLTNCFGKKCVFSSILWKEWLCLPCETYRTFQVPIVGPKPSAFSGST